jgi:RNA polymerase sigma factor (sigma-70 family)
MDFEQRFDSLFKTHYIAVYRYCLRRLGRADGEDAAAEVFAIAWRRLDRVPAAEATRAWLLGVAYRVVGNQYRSRRRRAQLSDRLLTERQAPTEPETSADVEIRLLHRAFESLREGDRELLRMSSWDGLSNSEIAAVIGIKENAIKVGFDLDHDTQNEHMHVVQLTPPGSGCSMVFGDLPSQREMERGSMRGLQLVVPDAQAARQELLDRGVDVSEMMVFSPDDGGTFFGFTDPDGNTWAVQELKVRAEKPLIPVEHRGRFGA